MYDVRKRSQLPLFIQLLRFTDPINDNVGKLASSTR